MIKQFTSRALVFCVLLQTAVSAIAAETQVPEPFRKFDPASKYSIKYDDLNYVLKMSVVDVGRSTRDQAPAVAAPTGTRMKANVKRATVQEGNRFYFELYRDDPEAREMMVAIQESLEYIPSEAPLEYFNRDEQLAYWLNLYNITMLNQINAVYPERKLKKLLVGRKAVTEEKLLNVAGVPLSLDDIQYTILMQNYDRDPLILYGLYQGIIGGPNIRKGAYTGANVRRLLIDNAEEFINSNRGTLPRDEKIFRASSLYDRNRVYFPDFQADLRAHLLKFLQNPERADLQEARTIKPDIDDWTITDLYGSYPEIGGSFATNSAALLDSVQTVTTDDQGNPTAAPGGANQMRIQNKASVTSYVSPELIIYLNELKVKGELRNQEKGGTVTVEELGEVPSEPEPDSDAAAEEND